MKHGIGAVLLALLAAAGAADPLPARAPEIASYDIEVRLTPGTQRLSGRQRVTWRNATPDAVGELWFHLYLNAFRNSQSTFVRESGGQLRGDRMPDDGWGWTEVTSIRTADGVDLAAGATFERPDDDNAEDRTVWRVPLPAPVPPGGTIELDMAFEAQLPRVFARTGYFRDYFLVGQWFPKLGVYEPAGTRGRASGGWNCHQFHANSEFYADFGRYRVAITLPQRFVVGATGKRVEKRANPDGTAVHVFEQADVHDFAWTASPRFVEVKARFSGATDVTAAEYAEAAALLGRSLEEVRLSDVDVTILMQPEHMRQAERHVAAAKAGIKWFGLWYGRYPYETLTVVDPAYGARGSGGMEYPTFITAGTTVLFNRWPLDRLRLPEEVTVHEFGHQYWQGMVASNEFEESWLDEGFNSYATGKAMRQAFGPWTLEVLGLRVSSAELPRLGNSVERMFDRVRTPAWRYSSSNNYGFNSYARTDLTLRTLEGLLGERTMARVMRTYHERFRFRHPSSEDFYAVVDEIAGRDMRGFFAQAVERPGVLDDEIAAITSARVEPPRGVFGEGPARRTISAREAREQAREKDAAGGRLWRSTVLVRRRGEVVLPATLRLEFEGGDAQVMALAEGEPPAGSVDVERAGLLPGGAGGEPWRGRFKRLEVVTPKRLLAARLDPEGRHELDVNRLNDARRVEPDPRAATTWSARLVFWMQQMLALAGL